LNPFSLNPFSLRILLESFFGLKNGKCSENAFGLGDFELAALFRLNFLVSAALWDF
jgi:hypothetical protein